jgi:hypothetical protein
MRGLARAYATIALLMVVLLDALHGQVPAGIRIVITAEGRQIEAGSVR